MDLPLIEPGVSPLDYVMDYLRRVAAQQAGTVRPRRYPPVVPAIDDKDGGHLPMTGKNAVRRRQEVMAVERQSVMRAQDAALCRALQWTGHWGG